MKKEDKVNLNNISLFLSFSYFTAAIIGVYHHELWRDELQTWQIAATAGNISEFYQNFSYEGHPPLWHFLLYGLSRFTDNPLSMQILHVCVSALSVYILGRYSPFSLLQKIAWTFGYYSLFEYGIISRSYSLGILLLFVFCALYIQRPKAYFLQAVILCFLVNTSIYGAFVAGGLCCMCFVNILTEKKNTGKDYLKMAGAFLLIIFGVLISALFILKIDSKELESNLHFNSDFYVVVNNSLPITNSIFAFPDFRLSKFWESNFFNSLDSNMEFTILSFIILGFFAIIFFRDKAIGFFYLLSTFLIITFFLLVHNGYTRHIGHLWLVSFAAMWLFKARKAKENKPKLILAGEYIFTAVLVIQLCSGVICYYQDIKRTFSNYSEIGKFIASQKKTDVIIGGNFELAAISAFIPGEKIYIIPHQKFENKFEPEPENNLVLSDSLINKSAAELYRVNQNVFLLVAEAHIKRRSLKLDKFKLLKILDGESVISPHDQNIRIYKYVP